MRMPRRTLAAHRLVRSGARRARVRAGGRGPRGPPRNPACGRRRLAEPAGAGLAALQRAGGDGFRLGAGLPGRCHARRPGDTLRPGDRTVAVAVDSRARSRHVHGRLARRLGGRAPALRRIRLPRQAARREPGGLETVPGAGHAAHAQGRGVRRPRRGLRPAAARRRRVDRPHRWHSLPRPAPSGAGSCRGSPSAAFALAVAAAVGILLEGAWPDASPSWTRSGRRRSATCSTLASARSGSSRRFSPSRWASSPWWWPGAARRAGERGARGRVAAPRGDARRRRPREHDGNARRDRRHRARPRGVGVGGRTRDARRRAGAHAGARWPLAAKAVPRFSALALVSVVVLLSRGR